MSACMCRRSDHPQADSSCQVHHEVPMLKDMKTQNHLKPGQKGTKRLLEKYGDSLLCVRYRYDEGRGIRLKTVEIVIEEKPWRPASQRHDEDMVALVVAYTEKALRDQLKAVGGRWNPDEKVWLVRYGSIKGTDLEGRILKD